jgi:hypothetical protein
MNVKLFQEAVNEDVTEPSERPKAARRALVVAVVGLLWLTVFHQVIGWAPAGPIGWSATVAGEASVVIPLVVVFALLCHRFLDPLSALAGNAVATAASLGAAGLLLSLLESRQVTPVLLGGAVRDAAVALPVCLAVAVLLRHTHAPAGRGPAPARPPRAWTPRQRRCAAVAAGSVITVVVASLGQMVVTTTAQAAVPPDGSGVCPAGARVVRYDVKAIQLPELPLNGWGDHIPDGMMYALGNGDAFPSAEDVKAEPGRATPLVMRAAVGDCLHVSFNNEIPGRRVGMHVDGVAKAVTGPEASDGARIGNNDDSTVATGAERTYTWYAEREGQFPINDYGSGTDFQRTPTTEDTTSHGLYGGLVVLPRGYTWHDPTTGENLLAGTGADLHAVGAPPFADARGPRVADDFRDVALVFLDEPEGVLDPGGKPPTFPSTGLPDPSFGFNYRTEPLRNRLRAVLDHQAGKRVTLPNGTVILPGDHFCDGFTNDQTVAENTDRLGRDAGSASCLGEESHLQSWTFGDQGKITKAHDETDRLILPEADGGGFTLTLKDPTLTGPLNGDGKAVDTTQQRFRGERTTAELLPPDATAQQVQDALMKLKVLPMAELAPGDITVHAVPDQPRSFDIAFGQHLAGRDVDLSVDGSNLTLAGAAASGGATVEERIRGHIEVLSDALIPHAYRGDPTRVRLIHAGVMETHPFHQHTNRWRQEPKDQLSTRLDVQSIGPGQTFELVYEGGAGEAITEDPATPGSAPREMAAWVAAANEAGITAAERDRRLNVAALAISKASNGDQIFHCHLYPHFAQGFWGALRVYDRQRPLDASLWPENMPRTYADATPIEPLPPLPDFDLTAVDSSTGAQVGLTPMPDAAHPGYPLFVKGEYLQRAYRAPGAVVADRFGDRPGRLLNFRRPGDTVRDVDSPATTDLERANMITRTNPETGKREAVPGSFFLDPCPTGVPVREYHPTAIDAKIVYNKAGWHDPDGKMYVEAPPSDPADPSSSIEVASRIRDQIQNGSVQPEPYNLRARLGECVNMRTTNATHLDNNPAVPIDVHDPDGNPFHHRTLMAELSTHVHLVRFDELATDGTSVGWNYVQAPLVGQTYNYRWFVDVPLRTVYFHDHQNPNTHQQHGLWAAMNVEPVSSRWTDQQDGNKLVPPYCKSLGLPDASQAGAPEPPCYGVGSVADVSVPGGPSFREFTVNYSDFVPMYDAAGTAINPPKHPDLYGADQGGMAINYRNEPFPVRVNSQSTGQKREPAYVFSSAAHGDPATPVFRAYQGDPVIFRFMGGAHEEGHNFTLAGHRWLHEPDDPNSNLYDSQFVMISEFFNMEVSGTQVVKRGTKTQAVERAREAGQTENGSTMVLPSGAGAPGDYLYSSQPLNDLWSGMWGIFRVPAKRVSDLQPLPSTTAPTTGTAGQEWPAVRPGGALTAPPAVPKPCAAGVPTRTYNISMIKTKIPYNKAGDNDPNGVMYVLNNQLDATGKPRPAVSLKPLFIRANEGDCLNITLTNRMPQAGTILEPGDPINPVENIAGTGQSTVAIRGADGAVHHVVPSWPAGNRASIHPSGLVKYFETSSSGSAVGYNWDTTLAPGQTQTYKYYVDSKNIGVANLADYGNLRTNRHHGAWGGLVVEPKGATYLNPKDLTAVPVGEQAVIKYVDSTGVTRSYREFVVDIQDGLNLYDTNGVQIPDSVRGDGPGALPDPEDMGEVGVNYRTEPFSNRLRTGGDVADVFSSQVHGDPATPVFRAYPNDPTMVRVLNSSDLPRVHTWGIFGHNWRYEQNDPQSNVINGQGGVNTGRAFNEGICAGSNTPLFDTSMTPTCLQDGRAGDYLYGDRNFMHMLQGGIWGLLRVHGAPQLDLKTLPVQ